MGYLIFLIISCVLGILAFFIGKMATKSNDQDTKQAGKVVLFVGVPAVIVIILLGSLISSGYQVSTGHIGMVYEFKSLVGQTGEGLVFVAPWCNVEEASVKQYSIEFKNMSCFSLETQPVNIDATLNLRVLKDSIESLYRNVGDNYAEIKVVPLAQQCFKDETVKYASVDIAPNREKIRKNVSERLRAELAPYSVMVVDLLLNDVTFNDEFTSAIESKQVATQKALEEEQRVQVAKFQADQKIEEARGEGEALLVVAEKQAAANRELNNSLSSNLIQYTAIKELNPNVQIMLVPSNQGLILPADMFKK